MSESRDTVEDVVEQETQVPADSSPRHDSAETQERTEKRQEDGSSETGVSGVHSGLQEATLEGQLDESVCDLSDQGEQLVQALSSEEGVESENKMMEVAMLDDGDDDDDDDNNEVSVADLPLPDLASMSVEDERSLSPMLSGADIEVSEDDSDDNETLTPAVIEEREKEEEDRRTLRGSVDDNDTPTPGLIEDEDRRTLRGSVDDNDNDSLRKSSYPSPAASDESSRGNNSLTLTDDGAGGDGPCLGETEKSSIDLTTDTTEPIEI